MTTATAANLSTEEAQQLQILLDPLLWAETHLNWKPRSYQPELLYTMRDGRRVVMRLGRRLGKTETMCVMILWYAWTQINASPERRSDDDEEGSYRILIICPYEEQVDLIFDRLKQLIYGSPIMAASVKKDIHHRIEINNGTVIKGQTAGSKSNTGAAATRGQFADVLIMDEVDYMADGDITNIINIANDDPGRVKVFTSSTPTGRRGPFYRWCTGKVKGWRPIHMPSTVNDKLMEINPETSQSYIDDLKDELTDLRYLQEVMAEFGEEQQGVYAKRYIDAAVALADALKINDYYTLAKPKPKGLHRRILGVDWDKYKATPNLFGMEFNEDLGIFVPIYRKEIPRDQFSLTMGVEEIINSDRVFNWDWIMVDRGYGDMQVEQLTLWGMKNNKEEFSRKIVPVAFGSNVRVRDPHTKKVDKKPCKQFMVNYSVNQFEKGRVAVIGKDRKLLTQLEEYRVKTISNKGVPTYTDENEHILDAMNLCFLGFALKYDKLIKQSAQMGIRKMPNLNIHDNVVSRDVQETVKAKRLPNAPAILKSIAAQKVSGSGRARMSGPPKRKNLR